MIKSIKSFKIFSAAVVLAAILLPTNFSQAATFTATEPTLRVGNYSQNPGSNNWQTSISANAGDIISFLIYYNNNSADTASQTKVKLNLPSGQFTSGSITGNVWASNANQLDGSVFVSLSSSQTLTYIPDSVRWYPVCRSGQTSSLPYSQSGSEIISGSGLNLGDISAGSIGCVVVRVQVGNSSSGSAPTVFTNSATNISQNSATLNGSVNPNNSSTNAWFEYGTTSSLGSTTGSQSIGSGNSSVSYSYSLGGLSSNTTYYFRAVASNSYGTTYGGILNFTTSASESTSPYSYSQPSIITQNASPVYQNSALLNGSVNPNSGVTSAWFQWGTTTNLNNTTTIQPVGAGASYLNYSFALTGLSANTTYYFRAATSNPSGTVYGSILSFTTSQASIVPYTYQPTQPQVIYTQSASKSTITSPSLVLLISNIDKDVVESGEDLNYVVVYKNISQQKLSSVVLKVTTPVETIFLGSNPRGASVEGNNITYQVGDLGINEEGTINIRVKVKNSIRTNDTLIFATVLEYLDKDDNFHSNNHFLAVVVISGRPLLAALISAVGFNWVWGLILGLIIGFLIYWFGLRKKFR